MKGPPLIPTPYVFYGKKYDTPKPVVMRETCVHEWGPHQGPIAAVATIPKSYHYMCNKCGVSTSSIVSVPLLYPAKKNYCQHEYKSDKTLGEAYQAFQACNKCGDQKEKIDLKK